jgi:hypothetical protein
MLKIKLDISKSFIGVDGHAHAIVWASHLLTPLRLLRASAFLHCRNARLIVHLRKLAPAQPFCPPHLIRSLARVR